MSMSLFEVQFADGTKVDVASSDSINAICQAVKLRNIVRRQQSATDATLEPAPNFSSRDVRQLVRVVPLA